MPPLLLFLAPEGTHVLRKTFVFVINVFIVSSPQVRNIQLGGGALCWGQS